MAKFFRRRSKKDLIEDMPDPVFSSTKEKDAFRKLQHRLSEVKFKKDEMSVLLTKYQNENNRMLYKCNKYDKTLEENDKLKDEIEQLRSELMAKDKEATSSSADLTKQLSDKTAEIDKLTTERKEMSEINDALLKKMAKLQHQNLELKATAAELAQQANDAIERASVLREKSEKEEQEAVESEQKLLAKVDEIKEQNQNLEVKLSQTTEREQALLLKVESIQKQIKEAEKTLSERVEREEKLEKKINELQTELAEMTRREREAVVKFDNFQGKHMKMKLKLVETVEREEALNVELASSHQQCEELEKTLAALLEQSQDAARVSKEKEQAIQAMLIEKEKKNQELESELAAEYSRSSDLEAAEELKIQMAAVQEKNCQLRLEKKQLIRNAEETSATLEEMKEKDNEIKAAEVRKFKELYEMTKFSLIERIKLQKQEIDKLRKQQRQFNLSKVNLEIDQMSADLLKSELKTSRELVLKLERELLQAKKHDLRQPKLVQDPRMAKKFSVLEQENKQLHRRIKNLTQTVTNEVREKTAHRRGIAIIKWRVAFQKLQKISRSKIVDEGCNLIKSYFAEYTDKDVKKTFLNIIEFIKEEHHRRTVKRSPRQREQRYRTSQVQQSEKPPVLVKGDRGDNDNKMNVESTE
jgi:hypothetical protein